MKPLVKGLIVALVHVCIVASLGVKLLYDRVTLPRVWVKALPHDPDLPIRGRYVSLRLIVEPRGIKEPDPGKKEYERPVQAVGLRVEEGCLLAEARLRGAYDSPDLSVKHEKVGDEVLTVLVEPVAFFIPEHVPDPSQRLAGEELWIDATIPPKGPPRPIALGVRKNGGPIVPLNLK